MMNNTDKSILVEIENEIQEYILPQFKYCGLFFSFREIHEDLDWLQNTLRKVIDKNKKHIYAKSQVEELAMAEIRNKVNMRKAYFEPNKENNISKFISNAYAKEIINKLEGWLVRILVNYKDSILDDISFKLSIKAVPDFEMIIYLQGEGKIQTNLENILVRYIDEKILSEGTYGDFLNEEILEPIYEDYLPIERIGISRFEETMRNLTGTYSAWQYSIKSESRQLLNEKMNEATELCEKNLYELGFMQELAKKLFASFQEKVNDFLKEY